MRAWVCAEGSRRTGDADRRACCGRACPGHNVLAVAPLSPRLILFVAGLWGFVPPDIKASLSSRRQPAALSAEAQQAADVQQFSDAKQRGRAATWLRCLLSRVPDAPEMDHRQLCLMQQLAGDDARTGGVGGEVRRPRRSSGSRHLLREGHGGEAGQETKGEANETKRKVGERGQSELDEELTSKLLPIFNTEQHGDGKW